MSGTLRKTIQKILDERSFDKLEPFKDPLQWTQLPARDREFLATAIVNQGHTLLEEEIEAGGKQENTKQVHECFDLASKMAPLSAQIYYLQGAAFLKKAVMTKCTTSLLSASGKFKKAIECVPKHFASWKLLAEVLTRLSDLEQTNAYFEEAQTAFESAAACSEGIAIEELAEHDWFWGRLYFLQGEHSQEALDIHLAVEKFESANQRELDNPLFWSDYTLALEKLAALVGRPQVLEKALESIERACDLAPLQFEYWKTQANICFELYKSLGQEKRFLQAEESFKQAAVLVPDAFEVWMNWAKLYIEAGVKKGQVPLIQFAVERLRKAKRLYSESIEMMSLLAEALTIVGKAHEKVEHLKEAEKLLSVCTTKESENPIHHYRMGLTYLELGRYFSDDEYFNLSLQQLQVALEEHPEEGLLWYALGQAYHASAEFTKQPHFLEQAQLAFSKAMSSCYYRYSFWFDWGAVLLKLADLVGDVKIASAAMEKFDYAQDLRNQMQLDADPELMYHYGCCLDVMGDLSAEEGYYEKAVAVFSHVLTIDENHHFARYNLALSLQHLGELIADIECFEKALEILEWLVYQDPEDELTWNEWGLCLLNIAQMKKDPAQLEEGARLREEAEEKFMRAMKLGCQQVYYNLACLYALKNQLDISMHYLYRAEAEDALPDSEDIASDEWLDNLKGTEAFDKFLERLSFDEEEEEDEVEGEDENWLS